jgi:hypothetical protein
VESHFQGVHVVSLFSELKRRKVFRVGIAYVVIAWLVAQVLQLVFEGFGTPGWVLKTVLVLLAAGFLFALFFAWAYEMTPQGLKRDRDVHRSQPITPDTIEKLRNNEAAAGQLCSIVYKSRSKVVADLDLVNSILSSSTKNNSTNGITGVLIATRTHFLQILEGEFEALNATFQRISSDTRHDKIQLISFTGIEEREFGKWAMHGIGLFDLNHELAVKMCDRFGEEDGDVRLPSTARDVADLLGML